jgi:hypothetical protein
MYPPLRHSGFRRKFKLTHYPASRLANRVQLTTDGRKAYLQAVEDAFGTEIDYAMLVKIYAEDPQAEKRYSPAECTGCRKEKITGNPDKKHISTSYVERQISRCAWECAASRG